MVHLSFSNYQIRMDVGDRTILYHFYKRTYTAVITAADQNEFRTFTHVAPGSFVTIMKHTPARRFDLASKTTDAMMNLSLWFNDLIFSLNGNIKSLNICYDKLSCKMSKGGSFWLRGFRRQDS